MVIFLLLSFFLHNGTLSVWKIAKCCIIKSLLILIMNFWSPSFPFVSSRDDRIECLWKCRLLIFRLYFKISQFLALKIFDSKKRRRKCPLTACEWAVEGTDFFWRACNFSVKGRLLISRLNCTGSEHKTPGQAAQSFQLEMKSAWRAFNSLSAHSWLQWTKGQADKFTQFHKICVKFTTTRSPFWSAVEMLSLVVLARTDITIAYT